MILAGPGSGKTTVVTNRILNMIDNCKVNPENILVITFTRMAALQMKESFLKLASESDVHDNAELYDDVTFGTFHSVFFMMLKNAGEYAGYNVITPKAQRAFIREQLLYYNIPLPSDGEMEDDILNDIAKAKGCSESAIFNPTSCENDFFEKIYNEYELFMNQYKYIDFEDMMIRTLHMLESDKESLNIWQEKYKYIMVDEFQDVSPVQLRLINMLAQKNRNIFVVGDDDQSIYGFRGAKPDVCRMFTQIYKEAEIFRLNMNYRCCETIVNASLSLINHNKNRFYKNLKAFNKGGNSVEYYNFNDISKQDDFVTGYVYNKIYNDTSSDSDESIAILTRTNAEASEFTHKLQKHGLNILYCGNQSDFFDKWVVKDVIAYLRISVGDYRRQNFIRIINKPQRYISRMYFTDENTGFNTLEDNIRCRGSKENLEEIIKLQCHVKNMNTMIPFAAVNYVRKVVGYDRYLHEYASERGTGVKIFLDIIEKLQNISKSFDNLKQFIEYVDNVSEDNVNDADGLGKADESKTHLCSVSTMHRAKGLEFDTVIIVSANEKNIPYCKAVSLEQLEEERRLFYVALTRAKKKLIICSVQKQYNRKMQSSRFIRELHL